MSYTCDLPPKRNNDYHGLHFNDGGPLVAQHPSNEGERECCSDTPIPTVLRKFQRFRHGGRRSPYAGSSHQQRLSLIVPISHH